MGEPSKAIVALNGVRKAAIGHPMDIMLWAKDSSRLRVSKAIKKPSGRSSVEGNGHWRAGSLWGFFFWGFCRSGLSGGGGEIEYRGLDFLG